jgi:hypothetical protein
MSATLAHIGSASAYIKAMQDAALFFRHTALECFHRRRK